MEPESEDDVRELYALLEKLYKEKVKKPLPSIDLFMQFWKSPSAKTFLVKYEGKIIGGSVGPVYANKVLYQWYVCGENGVIKGVHPSLLASWAPMEYGLKNGYQYFDFMGAGKPEDHYGVRDFKARFGGDEVSYGRYDMVCPLDGATALHQAWPTSNLHIIRDAGHSSHEPSICDALVKATNDLAEQLSGEGDLQG